MMDYILAELDWFEFDVYTNSLTLQELNQLFMLRYGVLHRSSSKRFTNVR